MLYFGGLTFCPEEPTKYLRVPNLAAESRIASIIREKYKVSKTLPFALRELYKNGEIKKVLDIYHKLMLQRDIFGNGRTLDAEGKHPDSFLFCLLRNEVDPQLKFKVKV